MDIQQQMPEQLPEHVRHHGKVIMSTRTLVILIGSLVLGLIALVSAILYIFVFNQEKGQQPPAVITLPPQDLIDVIDTTEDATSTEPIVLSTDSIFSKYVEDDNEKKDFTSSLEGQEIVIDWYEGAQKLNDKQTILLKRLEERYYKPDASEWSEEEGIGSVYGFIAGVISEPVALEGTPLYLVSVKELGMGVYFTINYVIYDDVEDTFIFINGGYNNYRCDQVSICEDYITENLDELIAPPFLNIKGRDDILVLDHALTDSESSMVGLNEPGLRGNTSGVLSVEGGKIAEKPSDSLIEFVDPTYGPVYVVDDQFRIVMPDGSIKIYDYLPYFFDLSMVKARKSMYETKSELNVKWEEGYETQDDFVPAGDLVQGCGGGGLSSFPNIVDKKEWFNAQDLIPVAETLRGEKLYALKNTQDIQYYKDIFDVGYEASIIGTINEDLNLPEEEKWQLFLADTAVVYWQDGWGNWRAFRKAKYQTLAECGKPVIYLYPEQETDVHVQVEPDGGFSITDPAYGEDGWYVRASSESELHNYADGQDYEYLFWEGYSYDYDIPCYGWVMSREEVPTRMAELLAQYGMNEKETADFMEFWEEKLTVSPYVYVTFLPQSTFDEMAPLTVDPAPDTVIRVFMDYMSLDEPIHVDEPYIITPERRGFTVVEWGGRLH